MASSYSTWSILMLKEVWKARKLETDWKGDGSGLACCQEWLHVSAHMRILRTWLEHMTAMRG